MPKLQVDISQSFSLSKKFFTYSELPLLQPKKILPCDNNFSLVESIRFWWKLKRIWIFKKDWFFELNGEELVIPKGFEFDGASIPRFWRIFFVPTCILFIGSIVHDFGYRHGTLLRRNQEAYGFQNRKWFDDLFHQINNQENGFIFLNSIVHFFVRIGGFFMWKHYRKNENLQWQISFDDL
jgi:hypothetical protein